MQDDRVLIIGSGPAGMACGYTLARANRHNAIIEKSDTVGGLCRTINFHGFLFDIGGHRFLSSSKEINDLWRNLLGDEMLVVKRLSRIYYKKKYFRYPLSFFDTFWHLGPVESFLCFASYLKYRLFSKADDSTFEGWITNRFGRRLYEIFFKTYTEKVWAVPCEKISADWAAQRIWGLSLRVAIQKALFKNKKKEPKTLSEEFLYPRMGPGEFYSRLMDKMVLAGTQFSFGKKVVSVRHDGRKVESVLLEDRISGRTEEAPLSYLFSTMPLPHLVEVMIPAAPKDVMEAVKRLKFRSFIVVNIILDKKDVFSDQWIYVHSPEVRLGRIQNYKNWSVSMVPDPNKTSLGLEYFCDEGDSIWRFNDIDMINYAMNDLEKIGVVSRKHLIDGFVVRQEDAYPIYEVGYKKYVDILRDYLSGFSNLQTIGRQGLFRYGNSDHALLMGIKAAKNFLGAEKTDLWKFEINEDRLAA